jgi:phospholipid transport system substrate-binding protein
MPVSATEMMANARSGLPGLTMLLIASSLTIDAPAAEALPAPEVIELTALAVAEAVAARRSRLETDKLERKALIDELLLPQFDLYSSCRLMLRQHWTSASPEQRRLFVDSFYRFLVASYGEALTGFRKDTLTIMPADDSVDGGSTRVRTRLKLTNGNRYQVDFYMRRDDRGWRIVDVLVEGVSYVRTYRTDFGLEIRANGLDSVIARLDDVANR